MLSQRGPVIHTCHSHGNYAAKSSSVAMWTWQHLLLNICNLLTSLEPVMLRSAGLNGLLYWAAFIKLPGNNAVRCVCVVRWPTATRFILACYYRCKCTTTFTEKAAFFARIRKVTAGLPLFPYSPLTPPPRHTQRPSVITSGCNGHDASLLSLRGSSPKSTMRGWVMYSKSFWQKFLNILILRTPQRETNYPTNPQLVCPEDWHLRKIPIF